LGAAGGAAAVLSAVIDRATLAVAAEAVGAMDSLLTKTVEYSKTRKQFGTAIGTFQALQHRMADMFIQCQLARSIVVRAAMILDSDEDAVGKARAVSSAKSRVGKAIRKVGQEAVQIHGGIGVTDELDVGHLFKRVTALDLMFGNAEYHLQRFASL
jgi:alkylation response protein AidB-like acyl-CoA dehydrogenase